MKKLLLLLFLLSTLCSKVCALSPNFYLQRMTEAEKLIPSTLSITLAPDETEKVYVDILPKDSKCHIYWHISPAVANLVQDGRVCTLTASTLGDATLTARSDNGLVCEIAVRVAKPSPHIELTGNNTIVTGESTVIYANSSSGNSVAWHVEGTGACRAYFKGNECKISARKPGFITVTATSGDTTVSKILRIFPGERKGVNLSIWCWLWAVFGVVLIIVSFICRRRYE